MNNVKQVHNLEFNNKCFVIVGIHVCGTNTFDFTSMLLHKTLYKTLCRLKACKESTIPMEDQDLVDWSLF